MEKSTENVGSAGEANNVEERLGLGDGAETESRHPQKGRILNLYEWKTRRVSSSNRQVQEILLRSTGLGMTFALARP